MRRAGDWRRSAFTPSAGRLIVTGHDADRRCALMCDGTLVTVQTGSVSVFDQTLQQVKVVSAPGRYLAKAP